MADDAVPSLAAESYILINADNGEILHESNSKEQRPPASVTKMMTLLLAVEAVENGLLDLEEMVEVSRKAAYTGGSTMYLKVDEKISFNDLLYGLALVSGNDASVAVAETVCGSLEQFVAAMNNRAGQLGMKNTHFVNANGLRDVEHYTTAADLALLAQECVQHPLFIQICRTQEYAVRLDTSKPTVLKNTNGLLGNYAGLEGIKTGWIGEDSGYCLAATAVRDDVRLVSVVLGAKTREDSFTVSEQLLDFGFSQFLFANILNEYTSIAELKVRDGDRRKVNVGTDTTIDCLIDKNHLDGIETIYSLNRELTAPLQAGEVVGSLAVINTYKDDKVIETHDLIILEDVAEGNFVQKIFYRLLNFF
ncbi:MAG: D-alanyl-D-alanine carboxypeptidase [Peptococcaceae bacterium]|nr:D-alanyl-D-alanine carboxypeptidase [Peptococcaceae bacterium]